MIAFIVLALFAVVVGLIAGLVAMLVAIIKGVVGVARRVTKNESTAATATDESTERKFQQMVAREWLSD